MVDQSRLSEHYFMVFGGKRIICPGKGVLGIITLMHNVLLQGRSINRSLSRIEYNNSCKLFTLIAVKHSSGWFAYRARLRQIN